MELIKWMMHLIAQHKCALSHTLIHMRGFSIECCSLVAQTLAACCLLPHTIHNTRTTFSRNKPNRYGTERKKNNNNNKVRDVHTIFLLTPQIDVSTMTKFQFEPKQIWRFSSVILFWLRYFTCAIWLFTVFLGSQPMLTKHKNKFDAWQKNFSTQTHFSFTRKEILVEQKMITNALGMVTFHFFFLFFFSLPESIHNIHTE